MAVRRILVFGASGAGATSLGQAMAGRLGYPHFDDDDYRWLPSAIPYQQMRIKAERARLLLVDLEEQTRWVLSGSTCGWADEIIPLLGLAMFPFVPTATRLERLQRREIAKYGAARLKPGGDLYNTHRMFMKWAGAYDSGGPDMRSLRLHDEWISSLACKVLKLEGDKPLGELLETALVNASNQLKDHPEPVRSRPTRVGAKPCPSSLMAAELRQDLGRRIPWADTHRTPPARMLSSTTSRHFDRQHPFAQL